MTRRKPSSTRTIHPLPFDRLSSRDFERLCLSLLPREGFDNPQHYGAAGGDQGRDIVGRRRDESWYVQCKRVKECGSQVLLDEIEKIRGLIERDPGLNPAGILFIVACDVSATARDQAGKRCAELNLSCEVWGQTDLDVRVQEHPGIVERFFDIPRQRGCYARYGKLSLALVLSVLLMIGIGVIARELHYSHRSAEEMLAEANLLQQQGDYEGALQFYNQVLDEDPDNVTALSGRGDAYRASGDFALAHADYTKAIQLDPTNAAILTKRGDMLRLMGDLAGALADYTQAISLNPTNDAAYLGRGMVSVTQGDLDGAIADCSQVLGLNPSMTAQAQALQLRATAFYHKGDFTQALADFSGALSTWQEVGSRADEGRILYAIGLTYAALENYDEARQYFNQSLSIAQEIADSELESLALEQIDELERPEP